MLTRLLGDFAAIEAPRKSERVSTQSVPSASNARLMTGARSGASGVWCPSQDRSRRPDCESQADEHGPALVGGQVLRKGGRGPGCDDAMRDARRSTAAVIAVRFVDVVLRRVHHGASARDMELAASRHL